MYAEERQRHILERARRDGRVEVADLAEAFDVTYQTVRRDLTALEHHGVLRRLHGGAIPVERLKFEPALGRRDMTPEKERIAEAALEEVPAGGTVLLDGGSTTGRLAEQLLLDLTVVTNSVSIAMTLMPRSNIDLMLLGGRVRARTQVTVEGWVLQALEDTRVDVAFMAADGVSAEHGLTTRGAAEAQVKRAMIRSARRVVLLADHTKVGEEHFARFAALDEVDCVITDSDLADGLADELAAAGPRVVVV